jgi:hypothetical protein
MFESEMNGYPGEAVGGLQTGKIKTAGNDKFVE